MDAYDVICAIVIGLSARWHWLQVRERRPREWIPGARVVTDPYRCRSCTWLARCDEALGQHCESPQGIQWRTWRACARGTPAHALAMDMARREEAGRFTIRNEAPYARIVNGLYRVAVSMPIPGDGIRRS